MKITRKSPFSGKVHTLEIPVTEDQLHRWAVLKEGPIQDIMPHLTAGQREFIMTGITEEEWAETFGEEA